MMLPAANNRHRRSIAVLALLVWLTTLVIGAAQACVPVSSSHPLVFDALMVDAAVHAPCPHEDSGSHQAICKTSCDVQTQDVAKKTSSASSDADRPVLATNAYFLPWNPDGVTVAGASRNHSLLFSPNGSLRFARLTL
jgi:hypothetical protein